MSAFSNTSIEIISIPSSVFSIGEKCFMNTLIKSAFFDIKSVCKNISEKSFFNTSLISISLPNSVAFIGNYAFAHCIYLKFVSYCSSVYQENKNIFDKSDLLLNVSVPNYYLHSSFCGLPALNYGYCKYGSVPKCPLCVYKSHQSVYVYLCVLFE
ncbi:choline binding protein, putative [Trichomonas vaginalis G3]|uniref:Choline binding protein, putative n=1 Tax=Trichomonas vaginalis (strain ATCC PRA-98 / G3) TaxID=412133 RepID=A2FA55_TRIV3|nr:ribonuclease inhibitor domain-containing protein [Trichomonas vaginalis G3]EAX98191.1 choline binding protein, putative [Trichomonas vaginalis G3]KAI5533705.1 ribonuclease inhibitor domain-containing protein [Trichomonas vaginalis G3]|eukprot:XP_001311121.1 choline binding protein [Trichomonas vaginalis G3]